MRRVNVEISYKSTLYSFKTGVPILTLNQIFPFRIRDYFGEFSRPFEPF
jgi:hypothetical protein